MMRLSTSAFVKAFPLLLVLWSASVHEMRAESPVFRESREQWGIDFVHYSGPSLLVNPEVIGPGVAFLDYDGDGMVDLFFVNGGEAHKDGKITRPRQDRLYRNLGDGRFEDVTERAGLFGTGMGNGATAADADNDGYTDLYLSGYRESLLFRNNGDGTFSESADRTGLQNSMFAASSCFGDIDRDGFLDLYIANYHDFDYASLAPSQIGRDTKGNLGIDTLGPSLYVGLPNLLFLNLGNGRFKDITDRARVSNNEKGDSRSMGVAFGDIDCDGWPELMVANDQAAFGFYRNNHDRTFRECANQSWIADRRGNMGIAIGDYNVDGWPDIFITHYSLENSALYRNSGRSLIFTDVTQAVALAGTDFPMVKCGCSFFDFDSDGLVDLVVANGLLIPHKIDDKKPLSKRIEPGRQKTQLFHNRDGRTFEEISSTAFAPANDPINGRGLAVGDLDMDGQPDLVIATHNGPPRVLKNVVQTPGASIQVLLVGTESNRDGVGARVHAIGTRNGPNKVLVSRERQGGNGYLSTDSPWLHLGLGASREPVTLTVFWPSGHSEQFMGLTNGHRFRIVEGRGTALPIAPSGTPPGK